MRTSSSQFQLLVEYMERNGDLSKPTEGPQGRASNFQRWAELTVILNADATGDTKTVEKWKKVWSDYKNNTKKKASRIYRAARGTGGGPASNLKLSDLEQKVLSIVGSQAATGIIQIPEIGLEGEVTEPPPPSDINDCLIVNRQHSNEAYLIVEDWNRQASSSSQTPNYIPPMHVASTSERMQGLVGSGAPVTSGPDTDAIGPLTPQTALHHVVDRAPSTTRTVLPSTSPPTSDRRRVQQSPTPLPLTPRRRRRGEDPSSDRGIRRRTRAQTQSELARQAFVRSDSEWRAFQQETERERTRIREAELGLQERWLDMFGQFVALGNRFANILEKK